jgi:hypothetical protein
LTHNSQAGGVASDFARMAGLYSEESRSAYYPIPHNAEYFHDIGVPPSGCAIVSMSPINGDRSDITEFADANISIGSWIGYAVPPS